MLSYLIIEIRSKLYESSIWANPFLPKNTALSLA